jgi:hypothetical protein
MSTRSKKSEQQILSGPRFVEGFLHFSPYDLVRYELAQSKVVSSLQAIGLNRAKVEASRRVYEDQLRALDVEVRGLVEESQRCENTLRGLQEELGKTYKIDLSKITYDDLSGKITILDPLAKE